MKGVELAVIIPCHNEEGTLGEQLEALKNQEWDGEWTVLVVDNRSTDRTVEVAESAGLGERLTVVDARDGQSVAYARNAGVRATDARSVVFCDGDDVVRSGWVAAMGDALRLNPIVTGSVDATTINEPWLAASRPGGYKDDGPPRFGSIPFARGNNTGMHRSVWEEVGGYDEEFRGLEDIEFSLRAVAMDFVPYFVPEAIVDYRYRASLRELWRQGWFYGRGRAELTQRALQLGLPAPSRLGGVKSWVWLVVNLVGLHSKRGRYAWMWVLANRAGSLAGIVERRRPERCR